MESECIMQFETIRRDVPLGTPIAVLHIGEQQTTVATGTGEKPDAFFKLPVGSRKTAGEYFRLNPTTPREIENAIVAVEDALASARTINSSSAELYTMDEDIRKIVLISGIPDGAELILTRDAMERTFERHIAAMLGKPNSREAISASAFFSANLLILREFMHHLQFLSITVKG